jgi:glycosyltransferase involved in cell wall biosynthesis
MTDRLKIAIITSSLKGGGAENHILNLCSYLNSISVQSSVITISSQKQALEDAFEVAGIPIHRVPLHSLTDILRPVNIGRIREILKRADPDIIHGHLYHGEVVASIASFLSKLPMITTRHSSGLEYNGFRRIVARLAARRISSAIVVSRDSAIEASATGIPEDRITIVHNGIDARRFSMRDDQEKDNSKKQLIRELFPGDVPADPILIGAAGALKEVKNYRLFILVASKLLTMDPSFGERVRFVIAGEGALRAELEQLVRREGLEDHIAMPGYIGGLEDYFPCLDIFLVTSTSEGVPIALLEAMSSGAACISSDIGDIGIVMGEAGITVPSGSRDDFVDAVSLFITDDQLRKSIGRKARVRVLENYDIEIWGERILQIYKSVLD